MAGTDWCPPVLLILVPQPLRGSRVTVCLASEGHSEEKTDYPRKLTCPDVYAQRVSAILKPLS